MIGGRSIRIPSRDHIDMLIHAVAVEDGTAAVRILAARWRHRSFTANGIGKSKTDCTAAKADPLELESAN
jgi:hypothetical protein